jgi:purine-nucleoside/S-methyl-5'-thioadenosine phosphorylase / adenosine deaminase
MAQPLLEARVGPARVWCSGAAQGNVGDHVGDDPAAVARSRAALATAVGAVDPYHWVWIRQVHGAGVHLATGPGPDPAPEADAIVTAERGLALAVVTADCAPLVLASDDAVGVVHAGHRGLALGVIEAAIARLRDIGTGDVRAFLGPCIRAPRYEFGAADLAPLVVQFGPAVEGRTLDGRCALDIPAAIAVVLERAGVSSFDDCRVCTSGSDGYFSFRRDGATGRQATIVVRP